MMETFPAKVNTETSSPPPSSSSSSRVTVANIQVNLLFLRSLTGILIILEIALGLLVWALIAGSWYTASPGFGWVMFVSILLWILTIFLFGIYFTDTQEKVPAVPWTLTIMSFNVASTVLYITAFIVNAASVKYSVSWQDYNSKAAAAFFACLTMIAYGASAFLSFLNWRGSGSNAATSQATGNNPA
ncbi:plasmolipin [Erpetoichthys calabaricus]|uniref:Plasmolipin n=1 Tax=Erpetoichthys calabaricus TaxID=27687 RepID=A0A8C4S194_ERPCA|nr:plasmolipin [Erpetoichthys calabaricus]